MPTKSKRTYTVNTAQGNEVQVEATRAEEDESGSVIRLYDGDDLVATFRGHSSFYITK